MDWEQKVVLVTGGAQGIGKAIACEFLRVGCCVVICDVDTEAGLETQIEYRALGPLKFVQANVASEIYVKNAIAKTLDAFGQLDILVNNAAISKPENAPIEQMTLEQWNQVMSVNLSSVFLCSKHAIPHLRSQKGCIINIGSTRALMSEPNTEAYSTAKGGILALTHALANSLGPDIRVNCISPGWIETGEWLKSSDRHDPDISEDEHLQHPAGRVGMPDDVAKLAVFLASEAAGFITGANFIVDGGMTHKMIYL